MNRTDWSLVSIPILLLIVLRLPALLHQPGGQDEQFFAVQGWTVWQTGVPKVPFLPAVKRESFFERSDRCLMALPPALAYVQAPFHALFRPGYPTARLPSFLGAIGLLILSYALARKLGASSVTALISSTALAISRPILFGSIIARPDLLCILCGLGAIAVLLWHDDKNRLRPLLSAGALCGLSALFHPFALVFLLQLGLWLIVVPGNLFQRFKRGLCFSTAAAAVALLWLPLILMYPDEFFSQFFSNVMERAGPALHWRLIWPFPSFQHHLLKLLELLEPWQFCALCVLFILSVGLVITNRAAADARRALIITLGAIYFTSTVVGVHHTLGYWLYGFSMVFILFGAATTNLFAKPPTAVVASSLLFLALIPGAGLRSSWLFLRHFGEKEFHAPTFIADTLRDLPVEGTYVVDLSYVFDVYLTGRKTLLCVDPAKNWDENGVEYDLILVAWEGSDAGLPAKYGASYEKTIGSKRLPQSCYVDVYRKKETP